MAIVDPPYGIDAGNFGFGRRKGKTLTFDRGGDWDAKPPDQDYFKELFRISKNQIIWGGNYFTDKLPVGRCWLSWNKEVPTGMSFADFELAWTSFDKVAREIRIAYSGCVVPDNYAKRIHPTQKPVALYKWLLQNYAKPGDKILDTHGGSMSIAIACYDLGFDLDLCELDPDYFEAGKTRFERHVNRWHEGMNTSIKDETDYSNIGGLFMNE